jgi:stage V sporulation protein G
MLGLKITEVRVRLNEREDDKLKAFASMTINDCFVVRDIKVINGNNGLFVAMPSRKRRDGSFKDIAHPLNNETRSSIENLIIKEYNKLIEGNTPPTRNIDVADKIESEEPPTPVFSDLDSNI